ncbi:MAG TPA: PPOX class F420-dependent oxidoreductase [Pseudonocardiaceae bacterium]|nr:PPOX class F420-dependent oxidoreductase [Pseudonocardiaceae bacterium]
MTVIPESHRDLLDRPLIAHLGTTRPDNTPQVNPMWFGWDGELIRFTNTTTRQKFRNVETNPHVSISIVDPDQPYRYLEVRGKVVRIEPDTEGRFFLELAARYGRNMTEPPGDAPNRVVLVVEPTASSKQ